MSLLHIAIFWGIATNTELTSGSKITSYIFNSAVLITILFFTYVSIFKRSDLISTNLGKIICVFIALFYLQRGLVETYLRGINPVNLGLSILIAGLYIIPLFPPRRKQMES